MPDPQSNEPSVCVRCGRGMPRPYLADLSANVELPNYKSRNLQMKPTEIIFEVSEAFDGGYDARALGFSIFTQGDDCRDLKEMVRDAVLCHFDEDEALGPKHLPYPDRKQRQQKDGDEREGEGAVAPGDQVYKPQLLRKEYGDREHY